MIEGVYAETQRIRRLEYGMGEVTRGLKAISEFAQTIVDEPDSSSPSTPWTPCAGGYDRSGMYLVTCAEDGKVRRAYLAYDNERKIGEWRNPENKNQDYAYSPIAYRDLPDAWEGE